MATTTAPETTGATGAVTNPGTLYDRADARATVERWIAEWQAENPDEDTLPADLDELLALADADLKTKMARLGVVVRREVQSIEAIDAEIKVLQARKAARVNANERRKRYAQLCLEIAGETKVETDLCTVAIQQNPPSVKGELTPETLEALFEDASPLVRFIPSTFALDKKAVLDTYKQGGALPAGLTVERSTSLRIR